MEHSVVTMLVIIAGIKFLESWTPYRLSNL
jgi:hypothetical protein